MEIIVNWKHQQVFFFFLAFLTEVDDTREGLLSPSSGGPSKSTADYLTSDGTSSWLLTQQSSAPPGQLSPASSAVHHGGAHHQLTVPTPVHPAAAAAAAAAAYQQSTSAYAVIDHASANSLGLGASAATFGAAGGNWHHPHNQGFGAFDPVKYQCSYDYSGAVRHPAREYAVPPVSTEVD
jgi:hypothetical protein